MTNRRDILQGAALATVPLVRLVPAEAKPAAAAGNVHRFHAVLVDSRHPESVRFGARLSAQGVRILALSDGDLTSAWLADIAPAWRRSPVPLAGLTTSSTLFCLEQLAWPHGMRVVFHAEHVLEPAQATGHVMHRAAGESASLRGPWWPSTVADLVAAQEKTAQPVTGGPSLAGMMPTLRGEAGLLTSWIIAPV
ncbi:MAG: hypothetical protein RLZZ200_1849 [Pseudomonadota bacterium]|jgi:hypothetical protein